MIYEHTVHTHRARAGKRNSSQLHSVANSDHSHMENKPLREQIMPCGLWKKEIGVIISQGAGPSSARLNSDLWMLAPTQVHLHSIADKNSIELVIYGPRLRRYTAWVSPKRNQFGVSESWVEDSKAILEFKKRCTCDSCLWGHVTTVWILTFCTCSIMGPRSTSMFILYHVKIDISIGWRKNVFR